MAAGAGAGAGLPCGVFSLFSESRWLHASRSALKPMLNFTDMRLRLLGDCGLFVLLEGDAGEATAATAIGGRGESGGNATCACNAGVLGERDGLSTPRMPAPRRFFALAAMPSSRGGLI